jgi:FkbM family methyltransferase
MIPKALKAPIKKILNSFGYYSFIDAFDVQRQLIRADAPVIFDIGARFGTVTKKYRDRFPLASIYCFEPFQESFEVLTKSVNGDPRTFCYNAAVCAEKGTAILNSNSDSGTNSLLRTDQRAASFWGEGLLNTASEVPVNTTTIDQFSAETGISHIDILKLDVQGAEFSVFVGAERMLSEQRVSLIYAELIMCPTYKGQHKLHEYLSLLDSYGYEALDFFYPVRKYNQLIQADVLFLSSSFKEKATSR